MYFYGKMLKIHKVNNLHFSVNNKKNEYAFKRVSDRVIKQ